MRKHAPILLSLVCAWATMLLGCQVSIVDPSLEFTKQADVLYQSYLQGNRSQARRSLEETIQLAGKSNLKPAGEADCLCFTYARLYALEKRTGTQPLAEAALVRARYWYLRQRELGGSTADESAVALTSYTAEKCLDFVDKWNKDHTGGRGPMYLQPQ